MQITVYNPQKSGLETIRACITKENTTWLDNCMDSEDVLSVTDIDGAILIRTNNYDYPTLIYDLSRIDIGNSQKKAKEELNKALKW